MNWNYSCTERKQKEMTRKSSEYDSKQSAKRGPYYSIYGETYDMGSYREREKKEKRRDKFIWTVGYIVMALLTIVFVCCLVWLV